MTQMIERPVETMVNTGSILRFDEPVARPVGVNVTDPVFRSNPMLTVGTALKGVKEVSEAMHRAGLNYKVTLAPVKAEIGGQLIDLPGERAIVRVADSAEDKARGFTRGVSKDYKLMQNEEVFGIVNPLLSEGMQIISAGVTEHGKRSFLLLEDTVEYKVSGDKSKSYLFVLNQFTGRNMVSFRRIPFRIDCWNAFAMAMRLSRLSILLPHTDKGLRELTDSGKLVKMLQTGNSLIQNNLETMAKFKITDSEFNHVVETSFHARPKPQDSTAEAVARWKNELEVVKAMRSTASDLYHRFNRDYPEFKNSVYAAYNGITEAADHGWVKPSPNQARSVLMGDRAQVKTRAHELLMSFCLN